MMRQTIRAITPKPNKAPLIPAAMADKVNTAKAFRNLFKVKYYKCTFNLKIATSLTAISGGDLSISGGDLFRRF
jgi:hypothetical protein